MPTTEKTFNARITELREAAARARSGTLSPQQTTDALIAAGALITLLDLRAYEMGTTADGDDAQELVVVTVYGVDLEIRGRRHPNGTEDLHVHLDDQRGEEDAKQVQLIVDISTS